MKQYADFNPFTSTQQGKQYQNAFQSEVSYQITNKSMRRATSNARNYCVKQWIDVVYLKPVEIPQDYGLAQYSRLSPSTDFLFDAFCCCEESVLWKFFCTDWIVYNSTKDFKILKEIK